ncbi:hypothetical protein HDU96_001317 [Phlyctochytrium bullatum]|nr:hypothetical protein HDU96_001317 [Phlyctochytrium bullatum]
MDTAILDYIQLLGSAQPLLSELSGQFSKRAISAQRDGAGKFVDAALFCNLQVVSCLENTCLDCRKGRLHKWFSSDRSRIQIMELHVKAFEQSLLSLSVQGRGSRFTSGRKKEVEKMKTAFAAALKAVSGQRKRPGTGTRPERPSRGKVLPCEVIEVIIDFVREHLKAANSKQNKFVAEKASFTSFQTNLASFMLVDKRWLMASKPFLSDRAVLTAKPSCRDFYLQDVTLSHTLANLSELDMLGIQLSEPKDTLWLRLLGDRLLRIRKLKLNVKAMRWSSLQHLLASIVSHEYQRKHLCFRELVFVGSMEPTNKPTTVAKVKDALRQLEEFYLDFREAYVNGDIRNRTISAAIWMIEHIGNSSMRKIRIEANSRLNEDNVRNILDKVDSLTEPNQTLSEFCLERSFADATMLHRLGTRFAALEVLSLPNSNVDDNGLMEIVLSGAPIRVLNISRSEVTGSAFAESWNLPRLEELYIDFLTASAEDVSALLPSIAARLKVFSVRNNKRPFEVLTSLFNSCIGFRLEKFDVFSVDVWGKDLRCRPLPPGLLLRMANALPTLDYVIIDFEALQNVSNDVELEAIIKRFPSLKSISDRVREQYLSPASLNPDPDLSLWELLHSWS